MASGDTKTNQYLDVAANGTRADLPTDTCCETRSQTLIRGVAERIITEEETRAREDDILQQEIDEIRDNPDVADIVATYADLQNYDTSTLTDKDVIRVLSDETHDGASTYYRYSTSTGQFTYIGKAGDYYTKSETDTLLAEKQDELTPGENVSIEDESGALVISATDTTYSDFTGTDGVIAGAAGLVPAPATTDAGKYLKADGSWDTVSGGIPTDATFWGASYDSVNNLTTGDISLGTGNSYTHTIRNHDTVANYSAIILANGGIGLGVKASTYQDAQLRIAQNMAYFSKTLDMTDHPIQNLADPTNPQDASTKNYTDNLVISYSAIEGSSAPTTSTEGKYVGQLYFDTTNDKKYYLKAIDTTTDPDTYTWEEFGGGGIPTNATFWGASYDSVNNKVDGYLVIANNGDKNHSGRLLLGAKNTNSIGMGIFPDNGCIRLVANGNPTYGNGRVTFGGVTSGTPSGVEYGAFDANGLEMKSHKITSVADPTNAQDAATKNYVDSIYPVGAVFTSTSATAPTIAGGTWTEIGTQTVGSSTVHYYERTA